MHTLNEKRTAGLAWQRSSFSTTRNETAENTQSNQTPARPRGCLQLSAERGTLLLRQSDEPDTVLATRPARVAALLFAIKAGGWRSRRR